MFKIKVLSRVHLNMWLFNSLHTVNGILPEGICLWTTFPPPSAFWHYIRHDDSWFLVLEPAWITICQRWTRFFWLSLRNPTNEWYQSICILSFDKCVGNTYFFQMRSKAFSSCKRTSLFGYRQHFKIKRWRCSIVPKNQHFSLQLEEVNSKTDFQVEKKKNLRDNGFFFYRNNISLLLTSFPIPNVNANEHSGRISFTAEIEPLSSCSSGWLFNLFGEQLYRVKGTGNKQKETATTTRPSVVFVLTERITSGHIPPYDPHVRLMGN